MIVKSKNFKVMGVSEYLEDEYTTLEQVVDELKRNSEIYPSSKKEDYFNIFNFRDSKNLASYDGLLELLKRLCVKTNTCLRIHLGSEIDEPMYFYIDATLIIDNKGNLEIEEFFKTIGEIESYYDEDGCGGTVPFYYCRRVGDGFELEDRTKDLEYFIDCDEDLDEEAFYEKISELRSELENEYSPKNSRIFKVDLASFFK